MRNQSWKSILSLCAVMALVVFSFACNADDNDEGTETTDNTAMGTGTDTGMTDPGSTMGTDPNAGMGTTGTGMTDDTTLQTNVQTAITNDPALSGQSVTATVSAGTVTLTGTVATQDQKTAAETAARNISGVMNVDNQITVSAQ